MNDEKAFAQAYDVKRCEQPVSSIKDIYGWTFNLCINPLHILMIIVWVGNTQYRWFITRPHRVQRIAQ
jgi:hypothetical protein